MTTGPLRVAALVGGGGRTLLNLLDRIEAGRLDAEVPLVIASRADLPGVARSRARGIEPRIAPPGAGPDAVARHDAIAAWLAAHDIDLVCLCGWLGWFRVDARWSGRVMNIHPALLPAFGGKGMYGERVHRAVLAAGQAWSGCTVHFVDDRYDEGPIILQRVCPVLPEDSPETLAARVFALECEAYPQAVEWFAAGRLHIADGRVALRADAPL